MDDVTEGQGVVDEGAADAVLENQQTTPAEPRAEISFDEYDRLKSEFDALHAQHGEASSRLGQYAKFGDPEHVQSQLERLRSMEDHVRDAVFRRQEPDRAPLTEAQISDRTHIERLFPGIGQTLASVGRIENEMQAARAAAREANVEKAMNAVAEKLRELRVNIPQKDMDELYRNLDSMMTDSDLAKFDRGNFAPVMEILEGFYGNRKPHPFFSRFKPEAPNPEPHSVGPHGSAPQRTARLTSGGGGVPNPVEVGKGFDAILKWAKSLS